MSGQGQVRADQGFEVKQPNSKTQLHHMLEKHGALGGPTWPLRMNWAQKEPSQQMEHAGD